MGRRPRPSCMTPLRESFNEMEYERSGQNMGVRLSRSRISSMARAYDPSLEWYYELDTELLEDGYYIFTIDSVDTHALVRKHGA
ncbi:hypothetical protein E4H04_07645 [Candidatus Bathyarchaeota archaeon]|nr:MAG: hypothetical protein E4H04_07645 [Candidatus Bathyarchaeota archaeon]